MKLFNKDKDYIIKDKNIVIIDELTGRPMEGRRYGDGLHQAIEAKENLVIQKENQTIASITYQNFFRTYNKLSGMTGTASTEAAEFEGIYNLNVMDGMNCIILQDSVLVDLDSRIVLNVDSALETCRLNDGWIEVIAQNGYGGYQYSIDRT